MALACWLSLISSRPSSAAELTPSISRFTGRYDDLIRAAVRRYWGLYQHPLEWKAQLYQESRLDPAAVSPVGARGLCQAMPATFQDWVKHFGWRHANPHVAKYCIEGGAFYMGQLRAFPDWRGFPDPDRHRLAQAAYNAGAGNIRKAQRRCGMASTYGGVIDCLASVTGPANARQTTDYVDRIAKWRAMMEAGR